MATRSPTAGLSALNALPDISFQSLMHACCATAPFTQRMLAQRPFPTQESMFRASDSVCDRLRRTDWLGAFAANPRIGGVCRAAGRQRRAAAWNEGEQAGVAHAEYSVRRELAELNERYFEKLGFVFMICATGKSAGEMRDQSVRRLRNTTDRRVVQAAQEQRKITRTRLQKALRELCGEEGMVEMRRDVAIACKDQNAPFMGSLAEVRRGKDAMKPLTPFIVKRLLAAQSGLK